MSINPSEQKLTLKQEKAVLNLLFCKTEEEAAAASGIGRTTLWKWKKLPEFKAALDEAKANAIGDAAVMLQGASTSAANVLIEIAEDKSAPSANRVTAARSILEYALKAKEQDDIISRLDELENTYNGQGDGLS